MLGQAGSGELCVSAAQSKLAAKVAKKFKEKSYGSSVATSGLTSSLAYTSSGNRAVESTGPRETAWKWNPKHLFLRDWDIFKDQKNMTDRSWFPSHCIPFAGNC